MSGIVIPAPALLHVKWGCRRCGYRGGVAQTTVPLVNNLGNQEEVMKTLLTDLRKKLMRVHMKQHCFATMDDFILSSFVPKNKTLIDKV